MRVTVSTKGQIILPVSLHREAAVRKIMKELFADQLRDRSPSARQKLTETLLREAEKVSNVPVDQFVLLAAAVDAAVDAGSLPLAFQAADRMAGVFDVDGIAVKAEAVTATKAAALTAAAAENVRSALELAHELAALDDFATAIRVCTAVQPIAAKDPELRTQLASRLRELNAARILADRAARDWETLKTAPDDPAVNLSGPQHTLSPTPRCTS